MFKIISASFLLMLSTSFASATIQTGTYSNDIKGCEIILSVYDFFGTGEERLVVELEENPVTPYGAFLTQSSEVAESRLAQGELIYVTNESGIGWIGSFTLAELYFNQEDGTLTTLVLIAVQEASTGESQLSKPFACTDLKLK